MNIGDSFIVGLEGPRLTPAEVDQLSWLKPAGIVLFKRNIDLSVGPRWPGVLSALIDEVKEATRRSNLIVSIDHEGGRVHRLPAPITHFPPACEWGDRSQEVGRIMGQELASLGVNLNFAPVFDILVEQSNRVIGDRAFGSYPEIVTERAMSFISGMEEQGVLGCAKHFPGHGATVEDSHFELPVCHLRKDELESSELIPFRKAIASGISLVMTAHVLFPSIDPENPATLSATIINGLLRKELGYNRAVISDALEMKALDGQLPRHAAIKALRAGVDLLLFATPRGSGSDESEVMPLVAAVDAAHEVGRQLERGALSEDVLQVASSRIGGLLERISSLKA